jgi:eukaryotic-like serine/threonine-protein kinase
VVDAGDRELARARALLAEDTFAGIDIVREAASGGMGRMFEGVELATGKRVAVKLLAVGHRTDHARFAKEAEILERLASKHVVSYIAHGVTIGGEPYLVMEWLDGETLGHRNAARSLDVREAVMVARRIAAALVVAHAHGIVHRDIKPSNVFLVDRDPAEAKLVDFGIARAVGEADAERLTATGQLVGTPGYMAPEQALGRDVDGRADLFGLGCLLYEVLYGKRPFGDGEVVEVLAKVLMQEPATATDRAVPPRLASLVRALLAKEPADRPASAEIVERELDEIARAMETSDHAALKREPYRRAVRRKKWPWFAGALAIVLVGGGIYLATRGSSRPAATCDGGHAAFATAWNPDRRPALAKTLGENAAALGKRLDQYGERWVAAHGDACRATRVRGEQTEAMLDLRMVCLERRRQAVAALVDVLSTADATTAARAGAALAGLPQIDDCAAIATLKQVEPPLSDPAKRARLDALAARLADARVRYQTGAFAPALVAATTIAEEARGLGYRPFIAESGLLQGQLEHRTGKPDEAVKTLEAAVWAAEAGRHDEVAARGWVDLLFLVGYEQGNHARVPEISNRASAAIARLGGNDDLEANLEQALGAIAASRGDLAEAVKHFEAAIPKLEKVFGAEHPNVSGAKENLATALLEQGDAKRAVALMTDVLAAREKKLDPQHALIGRALQHLGNAHLEAGDPVLGETELRRALAISEATLGPEHPELADLLVNLARAAARNQRDDSELLARRAITVSEKAFGADDVSLATNLRTVAPQLPLREADAALVRAEKIFTTAGEPARLDLARTWVARGDLALARKQRPQAIALFERALPVLDAGEGTAEVRAHIRAQLDRARLGAIVRP